MEIEKWTTIEMDEFTSHRIIPERNYVVMVKILEKIYWDLYREGLSSCPSSNYPHLLSGVQKIISYACRTDSEHNVDYEELFRCVDELFCLVIPEALLKARDSTIEQPLRDIISQ